MVCKFCKEKYDNINFHICNPNFQWQVGDNTYLTFFAERTLFNRFKWFISTKLFLPGTYKWIKK